MADGGKLFRAPATGHAAPAGNPAFSDAAKQNVAQDLESAESYFSPAGITAEQLVYCTKKAWAGIDVYVNLPAQSYGTLGSARILTVRIYARTRGNRSLVASGRVSVTKDAGRTVWAAAARCDADTYEVTYEADLSPPVNLPGIATSKILVTVLASDRNTAVPESLGQQVASWASTGVPQSMFGLHTATFTLSRMRLCGVQAVNKANAPRILQFRTTGSVGNPFAAFGMPFQGSPIFVEKDGLLPGVPRYDSIIVDVLTAAGAAAADGDVQWQFWFD